MKSNKILKSIIAYLLASFLLTVSCSELSSKSTISLEGNWHFQTDHEDVGIEQYWYQLKLKDTLTLPVEFDELKYFGRGPSENYIDKKYASHFGLYETTADDMYFPCIRPQENGHRTDVSCLVKKNGIGLKIQSDNMFEYNAVHNCVEDFDAGLDRDKNLKHTYDITPKDLVQLNMDYKMMGLGSDNS